MSERTREKENNKSDTTRLWKHLTHELPDVTPVPVRYRRVRYRRVPVRYRTRVPVPVRYERGTVPVRAYPSVAFSLSVRG